MHWNRLINFICFGQYQHSKNISFDNRTEFRRNDVNNKEFLSVKHVQYNCSIDDNYLLIWSVIDFVSAMTYGYAVDLYRKINGFEI